MNLAIMDGRINLARDAARIAADKKNFLSQLSSKSPTEYYDALRHMIGVRPGFVRKIDNAQAHTVGGLYPGYVSEDVNPATGYTERVYYAGGEYTRVLYNEKDEAVGAYLFKVRYDTKDETTHFDAYVLAPGDSGEEMQVKPDGSTGIFQAPGNFIESFSKKWLRPIMETNRVNRQGF